MPRPIEVETSRLRLRQWRTTDREAFAALNADPRVMEFFPSPLTRVESDAIAERCEALIAARGWGFWVAERKADGVPIGCVGLHEPDPSLPCSPCVEVAWRLAFEHWGHGYATEAARGALRVGFEQLGLAEIVSFTALPNLRSQAVMERLGLQRQAQTFPHPMLPPGHRLSEHCLYRLARQDFRP